MKDNLCFHMLTRVGVNKLGYAGSLKMFQHYPDEKWWYLEVGICSSGEAIMHVFYELG